MADVQLDENAIAAMAEDVSINLNAAADTETAIYANASGSGEDFYPFAVKLYDFSGACTTAVVTFGKTGGSCDEFLGNTTLSNISGTSGYLWCLPVPAATPAECIKIAPGETFGVEITTAEGSALTCKAKVFGDIQQIA